MANSTPVARVPKYAWWLAVAGGLIWVLSGLVILLLPGDPGNRVFFTGDPSSYSTQATNDLIYSARLAGVLLLVAGLLLSASPKSSSNNLVDGAILEQLAESF